MYIYGSSRRHVLPTRRDEKTCCSVAHSFLGNGVLYSPLAFAVFRTSVDDLQKSGQSPRPAQRIENGCASYVYIYIYIYI